MNAAFKEIVKSRNHEQREINEAYERIERYKEQIQVLTEAIQRKEQLVSGYDAIIEHSRKLLPKEDIEIVSNEGNENNE